jgi:hypothetical protein
VNLKYEGDCANIEHKDTCVNLEQHNDDCVNIEQHNDDCVNIEQHNDDCVNIEQHNDDCVNIEQHNDDCVNIEQAKTWKSLRETPGVCGLFCGLNTLSCKNGAFRSLRN